MKVEGLLPGFYHYQPLGHRLLEVMPPLPDETIVRLSNDQPIGGASVLILLLLDFTRESLKNYGRKAYRLSLLEADHIAQNVLLVAAAMDLGAFPICGFCDEELSFFAGLKYPEQPVACMLALCSKENC